MKQFEDKVLGYLDGSLDDTSRSELLHVLSVSPEKRALLDEHIRLQEALKSAHHPMAVPAAVERDLAQSIPFLAAAGQTAATTSRSLYASIAVIAAFAVVFSAILLQSPKNEPAAWLQNPTMQVGSADNGPETSAQHQNALSSTSKAPLSLNNNIGQTAEAPALIAESAAAAVKAVTAGTKNAKLPSSKENLRANRGDHEAMALNSSSVATMSRAEGSAGMDAKAKAASDGVVNQSGMSADQNAGGVTELSQIAELTPKSPRLMSLGGGPLPISMQEIFLTQSVETPWSVSTSYRALQNFAPAIGRNTYQRLAAGFYPSLDVHYNLTPSFAFTGELSLVKLPQFSRTIALEPDPVQPSLTRQVYSSGLIDRTGVHVLVGTSMRLLHAGIIDFAIGFAGGASLLGSTISPLLSSSIGARIPLTENLEFGAGLFGESNWVRPTVANAGALSSDHAVGIIRDIYSPRTIWVPGVGARISVSFHP